MRALSNLQETYNNITSLCYVFEEEEFENTTLEAKDFIRSLLVLSQDDRMSAAKALYHPWMLTELSRSVSRPSHRCG